MLEIITCILGTFGFSVLLKVSKSKLLFTVIGSTISAVIFVVMQKKGYSIFNSTFFAMSAVTAYSEITARLTKTPAGVILMPSTVPLLPGGALYYTMSSLLSRNYNDFLSYGTETVLTGAGIALGAVVISIFSTLIISVKNKIKLP